MFTLKVEAELRDRFMAEAVAARRPASHIVREFMRDFIQQKQDAREHDAWFRREVEQGLREADDPTIDKIAHDDIASNWHRHRAALVKRAGGSSKGDGTCELWG